MTKDPARELLGIGEFARRTGLSPKALRIYAELGLLIPDEVDPYNGHRRHASAPLTPPCCCAPCSSSPASTPAADRRS
jgi:hypothetical protein